MPKIDLPDLNFWLALIDPDPDPDHEHHARARRYWEDEAPATWPFAE